MASAKIKERMEVVGSDGQHVRMVDHVAEGPIKLTGDREAQEMHHAIPMELVRNVSNDKGVLTDTGGRAKAKWHTA